MTFISPDLAGHFSGKDLFLQVAALEGDVYRNVAGRRTVKVEIGNQYYFTKVHKGVGWIEILKNLLQMRLPILGAKNEWLALQRLRQIGIESMDPVLFCSSGWNPANIQSCIVTRSLEDTISLEDVVADTGFDLGLKRRLLTRVAEIARRMHEAGMNHRDFYLCHFLIKRSEVNAEDPRLWLIDLHRAQIRLRTPNRWKEKDVGGLLFSSFDIGLTKRDLLRFIKVYIGEGKSLRSTLKNDKEFWLNVERRAKKLYLQDHDQLSSETTRLLDFS
jgi:heptose I phosphotransferase